MFYSSNFIKPYRSILFSIKYLSTLVDDDIDNITKIIADYSNYNRYGIL